MVLSNFAVSQAKATGKPYTLPDSDGLSLSVSAAGSRSWHFRYQWMLETKRMSLGTYPEVSLREARALRDEARALVARGVNPRVDRKQKRAAVKMADKDTFEQVFKRWHAHRARFLKKGRQTALSQVERAFGRDVLPKLKQRSIYEIKRQDLLDVLAAIENRKALSVAKKVRTWLNQMFRYALVIMPDLEINPATDLDVVAAPQPPVRHHPFLRMEQLPAFLQILRGYQGWQQTQLAIRLLLLTGVRTGELRQATPDQFDLDKGLWIIPPTVVKQLQLQMRKKGIRPDDMPPYIVPLSVQAIEIVRHMIAEVMPKQRYLFPHLWHPAKQMSENTVCAALKKMGYRNQLTGHGIRGTISTALREMGYPKDWVESQLSHSDPDKSSAAYNHAAYVEQRRRMMQDWADRLDLFEQHKIDEASKHLTVYLDGAAVISDLTDASTPSPDAHGNRQANSDSTQAVVHRLPAVAPPRTELQAELSDAQRERLEKLAIYEASNMLSAAAFSKAIGTSRRWISYEMQARKVLALAIGNRGHRIPDWHLDPVKHRLIQAALKYAADADPWDIYRALKQSHDSLGGRAPVDAVTPGNFDEAFMATCFALREMHGKAALRIA